MTQDRNDLADFFGPVVHQYTRAQAIADGVLIDVSRTAAEAGFCFPVAMTAAAWADCVAWNEADSECQTHQDQSARLWDVVWMASRAARQAQGIERVPFRLYRIPRDGRSIGARLTTLHLHIGPGDDGRPVITILMPDES